MTEKYKIYLPEETKQRLMNDAELFEFVKKDGSVNLNAFLKELLVNYFDQYRNTKARLLETIRSDLAEYSSISAKDINSIANQIINTYIQASEHKTSRNAAVTFTVSGRSYEIMLSIEKNMLVDISLSQYMNDLFRSYLSISRSDREAIVFRDSFTELNDAIKSNRIITFSSTAVPELLFTIRPYMIAASKEEQCNYLLCADDRSGLPRTFRISRIHALYTTSKTFKRDEKLLNDLREVAARSPHSASLSVEAEVRLTDRGIQKFQVITKNRPAVERKDGNTYYFNWPQRQLEEYFKRFGEDALIVSPESSREFMRIFFSKAKKAYSKKLEN